MLKVSSFRRAPVMLRPSFVTNLTLSIPRVAWNPDRESLHANGRHSGGLDVRKFGTETAIFADDDVTLRAASLGLEQLLSPMRIAGYIFTGYAPQAADISSNLPRLASVQL